MTKPIKEQEASYKREQVATKKKINGLQEKVNKLALQPSDRKWSQDDVETVKKKLVQVAIRNEELVQKERRLTKVNGTLEKKNSVLLERIKRNERAMNAIGDLKNRVKDVDRLRDKYYQENLALKEDLKANEVRKGDCQYHRRPPPISKDEQKFG